MFAKKYAIHILYFGIVLFLAGVQLRSVEAFRLRPWSTRLVAKYVDPQAQTTSGAIKQMVANQLPVTHELLFPAWFGWAVLSAGSILIAHAVLLLTHKRKK